MVRGTSALLIGTQLVAGCSILFTREPAYAPDAPAVPAQCAESRAAPVADAAIAAAFLAAAGALVWDGATMSASRNQHECASCLAYALALAPAAYGTMAGASSLVGFARTRRCAEIHEAQRRCLGGDRLACAALQADGARDGAPGR